MRRFSSMSGSGEPNELPPYAVYRLTPGPLVSTPHPSAIPRDASPDKPNCSTRRGVRQLDDRYRLCTTASNKNPVGLALWERGTNGSHLFAVRELTATGKYYLIRFNASGLGGAGGSATTVSSAISLDGTGRCCMWQAGDRLHIIDGGGNLWYVDPEYTLKPHYRDYDANTTDGTVTTEKPSYTAYTTGFDTATDTVTSLVAEKVTPGAFSSSGGELRNTFSAAHSGGPGWWTIEVTFGSVKDWTGVEAIHIPYTCGASGKRTRLEPHPNHTIIEIEDSGGTYKRVSAGASRGTQLRDGSGVSTNYVTYSLKDLGSVNRATIKKIRMYMVLAVWTESGLDLKVGPITLGGAYVTRVSSTQRLYDSALEDRPVELAYRYRNSATNAGTNPTDASGTLGWFQTALDGADAIGETMTAPMPLGSWPRFAPVVNDPDTFPYGTGGGQYDYIDVCRRVKDGASRRWVRVTGLTQVRNRANSGDVNFAILKQDEVEVLASVVAATDYGTGDSPTGAAGYDPSVSGQVGNLTCGCRWNGVNVYASKDGKLFFGSQTEFRNVMWDNVVIGPVDVEDIGSPRTVDLGVSTARPVIGIVGADALYAFTASEAFVFTGTIPSLADGPFKVPSSKGCLGFMSAVEAMGGAVAGSDEGLYFYRAPSSYSGSAEGLVVEELTKDVRPTWQWLLGSARSKLVVCAARKTLWCFCEDRYMRLDEGHGWSHGSWADGAHVHAAVDHPQYGLALLRTSNGTENFAFATVGAFPTDGGTNAGGTNGTSPTWSYKTSVNIDDANLRSVRVHQPDGYFGTTQVEITHELGSPQTLTFTATKPSANPTPPCGGRWVQLQVSGGASEVVAALDVELTSRADARAKRL